MKKPQSNDDWKNIIKFKLEKKDTIVYENTQNSRSTAPNPSHRQTEDIRTYLTSKSKPTELVVQTPRTKIKVFINSEGTITLQPSSKKLSQMLSLLDNSIYDIRNNLWKIHLKDYVGIRDELHRNMFVFENIPRGVLDKCSKEITDSTFDFSDPVFSKLFKFQLEGVAFCLNRGGRAIIADEMGLGKTFQSLAVAYYYKLEWPFLVISPASLQDNWAESIKNFLGVSCTIIRSKTDIGEHISVISYEMASKFSDILKEYKFKIVICDECHFLKGQNTKRTLNIVPILQKAARLVMISGTPALSRPVELYNIFNALDKSLFPNFFEYGKRYCNARKVHNWMDFKGSSNVEELTYIFKKYFMIRRTKDEVLSQLPPKFRQQVIVTAKNNLKPFSRNLVGDDVDQSVMAQYNEAAQLKINAVTAYIDTVLATGTKFIVFAHHGVMMDGLCDHFVSNKVEFVRIDGTTPVSNRHRIVKKFQENDDLKVAVLSLTACNTGLTLTAAKAVIFAELYWNPGTLLQAEDRIHRIGQQDSVNIYYIVARNTIDEYVWPVLLKKLNVLQSLGIGQNKLKNMKNSEFCEEQETLDRYF